MRSVRRAFDAAAALRRPVLVPAVVLAELYRGPGRNARVDSCLSRESRAIDVRDTDRSFARYVGGVLAAAGAGSELMADAHVVATAVEAGGGIVLTGDPTDIGRLAAAFPNVVVEAI
jgi:predicted nucleic acid-binding protein